MECTKNLLLEMSPDQMDKLDEVLQSDHAKALLQETTSKLFEPVITVALENESTTIPSNLETISSLSDLENLVLDHGNSTDAFLVPSDYIGLTSQTMVEQALEMDIIFMDHCYSLNPVESLKDNIPIEEIHTTEIIAEDQEEDIVDASKKESDSNAAPIRRSLRQIEKVEREQLEKIKAENAELQKREKEEMERIKVQKDSVLKQKEEVEKDKRNQDFAVQIRNQRADDEHSQNSFVKEENITHNTSSTDIQNEESEESFNNTTQGSRNIDNNTKEIKKKMRNRRTKSEAKDDITLKDSTNNNLNIQNAEKTKRRQKRGKLQKPVAADHGFTSESENSISSDGEEEKDTSPYNKRTFKSNLNKSPKDKKFKVLSPKKKNKTGIVSEDIVSDSEVKSNEFRRRRRTSKNTDNALNVDNETNEKVIQKSLRRRNQSINGDKIATDSRQGPRKSRKQSDSVSSDKHSRAEDNGKATHKVHLSGDKDRRRSVSFGEDKDTDPNSSQSFEMKIEKPKIIKQPRKSLRRESHNSAVELFEPALFSQPDVMVKIKSAENDKKDDASKKGSLEDFDGKENVIKLECKDIDKKHEVGDLENKHHSQIVKNKQKDCIALSKFDNSHMELKTASIKFENGSQFKGSKWEKKGDLALISEAMLQTPMKKLNNRLSGPKNLHTESSVKSPLAKGKLDARVNSVEKKCPATLHPSDSVDCDDKGSPIAEAENLLHVESIHDAPETIADIEEALREKNPVNMPNELPEASPITEKASSVAVVKPATSKWIAGSVVPERKSPRNLQWTKRTRYGDSPTREVEVKKVPKEKPKRTTDSPRKNKRNVKSSEVVESNDENEEENESSDDPEDSDWSSEDDPEKLWCICRKPHNHRFMIQCDSCKEWFHGSCVGVSRQQGRQLEKQKKEWKCPHCNTAETVPKSQQIQASHLSKHTTEKKEPQHDEVELKKAKDERRKSDTSIKAPPTRKLSDKDLSMKREREPAKLESEKFRTINKTEVRKVKEEIGNEKISDRTTSKATATDRKDAIKVDKSRVLQSKEKDLSDKDKHPKVKPTSEKQQTLSANEKANSKTDKSNLVKVQKSVSDASVAKKNASIHRDNKLNKSPLTRKNPCLVCSKSSYSNASYCSTICLEKHVTESLKLIQDNEGPTKVILDPSSKKVVVLDRSSGQLLNGPNAPSQSEVLEWLKEHPTYEILRPNPPCATKQKEKEKKPQPSAEPKDMQEEVGPESIRYNVRKTLKNTLESRCKNANDSMLPEEEVRRIANRIEEELYKLFKDTGTRYKAKYRSLMFNIKDPRNQGLFRKILKGKIPADRLVRMTTEELASVELAKWREKENQHVLDMIKREQLEQQHQAATVHITKKTHKGEVEIEDESGVAIEESFPKVSQKPAEETMEPVNQEVQKDTTNNHRSHLFDLNCKICTGKVAPPPVEEPLPKKMRVAHSISVDYSSSSASDTVEKNVSRIVGGEPPSPPVENTEDSADREPSATVSVCSPDNVAMPRHTSGKTVSSVWKGFIFMQEIAKFVTSAYKVSGPTDFLSQDIPDTIQVCGRIIPDQVWDYLSKIKQSGNKELIVIRFQAANEEENRLYTQFYSYLHTRKRYGVVSGYSKMIKDFYILPLAGYNPVPTVLMPFDGPGLDAVRTHLLLGVIVRHRTRPVSSSALPSPSLEEETDICEGSYTPPIERDSYTPPLPAIASPDQVTVSSLALAYYPSRELKSSLFTENFEKSIPSYVPSNKENTLKRPLDDEQTYERSFTPPLEKMPKMEDGSFCAKDEDSRLPYDPEEYMNSAHSPISKGVEELQPPIYNSYTSNTTITNLIKKLTENSSASNNSATSTPTHQKNYDRNQSTFFSKQSKDSDNSNSHSGGGFEDNDNHVTSMSPMTPEDHVMNAQSPPESPDVEDSLQHMNNSGMSSFLDLPQNLQDILNTVKHEQEKIEKAANSDVDQRYFPSFPVDNRLDSDASDRSVADVDYRSQSSSQEGSPHPYDKNANSVLRPSDPRIKIRTSFDEAVPSVSATDATKSSLSSMSASELLERAQKQLEEMEASENAQNSHADTHALSSNSTVCFPQQYHGKLWHTVSEPLPPGIDPTDISNVDNVAYTSKSVIGDGSLASIDHVITPPYPPPSGLSKSHPLGPTYLPPPIPNTLQPPPNYVHTQPPRIETYPNQQPVAVMKPFPPSLPPTVPPPTFPPPPLPPPHKALTSQPPPLWPPPGHPPVDVDWRTRPSHWEEDHWGDWDMRPVTEGGRSRPPPDYFDEPPPPPQPYGYDEQEPPNWNQGRHRNRQGYRSRDQEQERNFRWDRNRQGSSNNQWNTRPRRGNRRNDHWRGNRRNFNHRQPD